ncbi:MAG: type II toxin-antitoxin system HicB family antitoxin [Chloroflexota bacterium]
MSAAMTKMKTTTNDPTRGYRLDVRREVDGTWTAVVPQLPGCVATGESIDEVMADLPNVIDLWIATADARGQDVPEPNRVGEYSGKFVLRLPKGLHARLVGQATGEGVSLNSYCATALAEVTGARLGADIASRLSWSLLQSRQASRFIMFGGGYSAEWRVGASLRTLPANAGVVLGNQEVMQNSTMALGVKQ